MKPISSFKTFCLSTFSKPANDRIVYRTVRKLRAASILEIGLGNADRAENTIRIAKKYSASGSVRYTGIDQFEADPKSLITLKSCHHRLSRHDVKLQLVPGPIFSSIHRIANSHTRTDLLVVSQGHDEQSLEKAWFYFPRMLHAASVVLLQDENGDFQKLTRLEIERKLKNNPTQQVGVA